jgi:rhodanese-related sulfurtransferase
MKSPLGQAALLLVIGAALSLAANAVSPRGLKLSTDYFPKPNGVPAQPQEIAQPAAPASTNDPLAVVTARLRAHGLQPLAYSEVVALYQSPDSALQKIIFLDSRDDQHFQSGHIPGAWPFDRYRLDQSLPAILAPCLQAEKIVVYCNGGECEDSEFAALALSQSAGVPAARVFVYPGGITEWEAKGQPVETGLRGSGTLRPAKP